MQNSLTRRKTLALLGASLLPVPAFAAGYPDRPIRMIVALAAGGPADAAARAFAPYFSEAIGQSVIVENRTGASSVIGTEAVIRATPDGYTLLFGSSSTFAVNPAVMKNLRFDVNAQLNLVGLVSYTPHVLVVRSTLPVNSLAELVALAKKQPGKLTYASSGTGGAIHLASELFKQETGTELVHVPYRGGGPAVLGLLANDVDVFFSDLSTTIGNIHSGRLKALAMAVVSSSWFGLAAPVDTPADIIAKLHQGMTHTFANPAYQAAIKKLGNEQFTLDPNQSKAFIKGEVDKWASVAKKANIQIE